MDDWQKAHIDKNIVQLINTTNCNVSLLASLKSRNVLSEEDVQQLSLPSSTPSKNAAQLYDFLKARKDSYSLLVEALKDGKQSGAVDILERHNVKYYNFRDIKYDKNHVLGGGGFSTVYGGEFGGKEVAVKVQSTLIRNAAVAHNEIKVHLKLKCHPNVVQYLNAMADDNFVYIVLERCAISLQDEVKINMIGMDDVDLLRKCTTGLNYLHAEGVIHGDLKPSNVLLTVHKEVKISDFGLAKEMQPGCSFIFTSGVVGTNGWMAPELLDINVEFTNKSSTKLNIPTDVFALGCIFYFVLSKGAHPFGIGFNIPVNICANKPNLQPSVVLEKWHPLILKMISHDPSRRPTTATILSESLFASMSQQYLLTKSNPGGSSREMQTQINDSPSDIDPILLHPQTSDNFTLCSYDASSLWEKEQELQILVVRPSTAMSFVDDSYMLPSGFKGFALILNITKFEGMHLDRIGAENDTRYMAELWTQLGYEITKCEGYYSRQQVRKVVEEFRAKFYDTTVSDRISCVVYLASNGTYNTILCSDEKSINIYADVIYKFGSNNCPALVGKPKIFLIQACQDFESMKAFDGSRDEIKDAIVSFSSTPGAPSYRNFKLGGFYAYCLSTVFMRNSWNNDLLNLFKLTQEAMENATNSQLPTYLNFGMKTLYFNMYPDNGPSV